MLVKFKNANGKELSIMDPVNDISFAELDSGETAVRSIKVNNFEKISEDIYFIEIQDGSGYCTKYKTIFHKDCVSSK